MQPFFLPLKKYNMNIVIPYPLPLWPALCPPQQAYSYGPSHSGSLGRCFGWDPANERHQQELRAWEGRSQGIPPLLSPTSVPSFAITVSLFGYSSTGWP